MTEEFEDQLPDSMAMQKDSEARALEEESKQQTDLLGQLLEHVDKDQYITWERVQLPSKGVYYDDKMPNGYIEVKPMGVDVDKMLTNQRLVQTGQLLSKIIEACTRLPDGFDVREMLAGDFNFLLYYLRGITHGPAYEFVSECPSCKTKNTYEFDLMELSNTIKGPHSDYPEEPMEVELPILTKTFSKSVSALVRLVRVDDIMKMSRPGNDEIYDPIRRGRARIKKKDKKGTQIKNEMQNMTKIYEDNMKMQIVGFVIDGEEFKDERRFQLIDNLHQQDAATIREFIDDISPSVDTSLEVTCQNEECGLDMTISLPWSENFFRPTK